MVKRVDICFLFPLNRIKITVYLLQVNVSLRDVLAQIPFNSISCNVVHTHSSSLNIEYLLTDKGIANRAR
jgi:hypothetical protein